MSAAFSPLPYHGGKARVAAWAKDKIPPHICYVEPFAGGLSMLFAKGHPQTRSGMTHHLYQEVVNDCDGKIVELWRALQSDAQTIARLMTTPYSKAEHDLAKTENSPWATYVATVQSFGGQQNGTWGKSPPVSSGVYTPHHGIHWRNRVMSLPDAMDRMKAVIIECDDALNVISRWAKLSSVFVYADPPYPGTGQSPYEGKYESTDMQQLVDCLEGLECSFMLSGYDGLEVSYPDSWTKVTLTHKSFINRSMPSSCAETVWFRDNSHMIDASVKAWSPSRGFGVQPMLAFGQDRTDGWMERKESDDNYT